MRVAAAVDQLGTLLPSAALSPVTVLVGRCNSGGVTAEAGVVIGLQALCDAAWMQADVGDRFVHLIAHEYVHVQQPSARVEVEQPTLPHPALSGAAGSQPVAARVRWHRGGADGTSMKSASC